MQVHPSLWCVDKTTVTTEFTTMVIIDTRAIHSLVPYLKWCHIDTPLLACKTSGIEVALAPSQALSV